MFLQVPLSTWVCKLYMHTCTMVHQLVFSYGELGGIARDFMCLISPTLDKVVIILSCLSDRVQKNSVYVNVYELKL